MNLFTEHPHKQGVSYFEHWDFAMGIAWRLLSSTIAFIIHAVLPCISIKPRLDLEATAAFLAERNTYIEIAAAKGRVGRGASPLAASVSSSILFLPLGNQHRKTR